MEKEVGTEVKLHLPRDPLNGAPLDEAQDTGNKRNPKDEQREKENSFWRYCKAWTHIGRVISTSPSEFQLINNCLENLWANQEQYIRHKHEKETEYNSEPIPNDILLETE